MLVVELLDVELDCDVNDSLLPIDVVELEAPLVPVLVLALELLPIVAIDSSEVPMKAVDVVCGLVVLASVVVELLGVEDNTEVNASVLGSGVVDVEVEGVLLPVLLLISVVISAEVLEKTKDDVSCVVVLVLIVVDVLDDDDCTEVVKVELLTGMLIVDDASPSEVSPSVVNDVCWMGALVLIVVEDDADAVEVDVTRVLVLIVESLMIVAVVASEAPAEGIEEIT